ncbi:GNAT family N-acetyltransferase [Streptomyces sp. NPDC002643]
MNGFEGKYTTMDATGADDAGGGNRARGTSGRDDADIGNGDRPTSPELPAPPAGYRFRACAGHADHTAMAAVRLGCVEWDGIDVGSLVEGVPTADEIAEECGTRSGDRVDRVDRRQGPLLVEYGGRVVGYVTVRWWEEPDGTWLYLHRGHLLPEHRGRGVGSAMLAWAERRVHDLVRLHGTASTAVLGANAMASEADAAALLLDSGYRQVFSLVELDLADLARLPDSRALPDGIRLGGIGPSRYRAAWRTVVGSYDDAAFTPVWSYERFLATADPRCWRGAWHRERMVGVALCRLRGRDGTVGEIEELSVREEARRPGLGRALLVDSLRCLREHGAHSARLYTGTADPYRSYDLYESVGFQRRSEYVRYRKPLREA